MISCVLRIMYTLDYVSEGKAQNLLRLLRAACSKVLSFALELQLEFKSETFPLHCNAVFLLFSL